MTFRFTLTYRFKGCSLSGAKRHKWTNRPADVCDRTDTYTARYGSASTEEGRRDDSVASSDCAAPSPASGDGRFISGEFVWSLLRWSDSRKIRAKHCCILLSGMSISICYGRAYCKASRPRQAQPIHDHIVAATRPATGQWELRPLFKVFYL